MGLDEVAMRYHNNARLDGAGRLRAAHLLGGDAFLEMHDGVRYLEREELAELLGTPAIPASPPLSPADAPDQSRSASWSCFGVAGSN